MNALPDLTADEIAALPKRKTWYGIVGTNDQTLTPQYLSDDATYAKDKAYTLNKECPLSGPWSVVALVENLRVTP